MKFNDYQNQLEILIPQLSNLGEALYRVVDLGDDYFLHVELDIPEFDLSVRLLDSNAQEIKLLEGIPPSVLLAFSQYQIQLRQWMETGNTNYPIPYEQESIQKFDALATTPDEAEKEFDASQLEQYKV